MEASSNQQQQKEKEPRIHRPCAFDKMEGLVREMQDPESGVPVRSQKQFLTSIPSAFMGECQRYLRCGVSVSGQHGQDTTVGCLHVAGYDLIEWLMERLAIEESVEAVHIANQLCQYGYFFPVNDSKTLTVKDDSSLYRFQSPYYWPWQKTPDNVEYAIYLAKRTLRNKQRHALEDYELEALNSLRKNLQNKWDAIQIQAEEQAQVRIAKERKKGDKIVSDSQERAFWRVYRPPPGCLSSLEAVPVPTRFRPGIPRPLSRKRTLADLQREVSFLRNNLIRTRIKVSTAVENLKSYFETHVEYDPMFVQPQPSNPWITDDHTFWQLNSPLVEVPTEKRVKRWGLSMEELMSDPRGLQEFTNYLKKEYSHENIRFWVEVKNLRHSNQAQIPDTVNKIFREFLAPGAPCEINIDGKTMERIHQEMKNPSRFTFDSAAEHVYTLLLKKDCYPRFIRSDQYRNLLAAGVQPLQKKRFFGFGGQAKKKVSSTSTPTSSTLQHISSSGSGGRRRGSDRSLTGSAHELAVCGVRDVASAPRVPHSHSQSNLTDIPYRGDLPRLKIPSRPSPRSIQITTRSWAMQRTRRTKKERKRTIRVINALRVVTLSALRMLARRKWRFALWTTCARGRPCRDRAPSTDRRTPSPLEGQHQLIKPGTCGTAAVTRQSRTPPRPRAPPARIPRSWTPAARRRTSVSPSRRSPSGCGSHVVCNIAVA
ncbi:regulator of G-protein signaling 7 isoform X10 [Ooceraea biroi]|uniref:regulator of G-protein signaling 7 isoform X10 n=1 Tax=Ooceraea biroi TaxID=2015173 RepID=UPI0009716116|nr:regulator of G-protein signaling 7 isoform X10 [Ooceraea biroi]